MDGVTPHILGLSECKELIYHIFFLGLKDETIEMKYS